MKTLEAKLSDPVKIMAKDYRKEESMNGVTRSPTALIQLADCFLQPAKALNVSGTDDLLENLG
jgi:hypothetical protein